MSQMTEHLAYKRDQFIKDGKAYTDYLVKVKDLPDNLKLLVPHNFLRSLDLAHINNIRILELAAGPGYAGTFLDEEFERRSIPVEGVTFIDLNKDRLKHIEQHRKYTVIEGDIFEFPNLTKTDFTVIVARYCIYYFTKKRQYELLKLIHSRLQSSGCIILASFGITKPQVNFLTEIHKLILKMQDITYDGLYLTPATLSEELLNLGFLHIETAVGLTIWNTEDLGNKFGLDPAQKAKLKDFVQGQTFLKLKLEADGSISFDVPAFTITATK